MNNTLSAEGDIRRFYTVAWLCYCSTYIGRLGFTVSAAQIVVSEELTRLQLGMIGSGFFAGYGLFQLVSGIAGARLRPRQVVLWGLVCSGLCNLVAACARQYETLLVVWTLNGIAQSFIWTPLFRLTVDWLPEDRVIKAGIRYAATTPAGTLVAYALGACCIAMGNWRATLLVAGGSMVAAAVAWQKTVTGLQAAVLPPPGHTKAISTPAAAPKCAVLFVMACAGLCAVATGLVRDGISGWMPLYFAEAFGLSAAFSVALAVALPLLNLFGAYAGNWMNNRFKSELYTVGACLGTSAVAFALVAYGAGLGLVIKLLLFGVSSFMMLAANTALVTILPIQLKQHVNVSVSSGIFNSLTYAGSVLSGAGCGGILQQYGWHSLLLFWLGVCLAGAGGSFIFGNIILKNRKRMNHNGN